jgi:hypothetical protein
MAALAPLDAANVRPVQTAFVSECLLGIPLGFSQFAYALAQTDHDVGVSLHGRERRSATVEVSTVYASADYKAHPSGRADVTARG